MKTFLNILIFLTIFGVEIYILRKFIYGNNIFTQNRFAGWLYSRGDGKRTDITVTAWWEKRRIPYNVIVLPVAMVSYIFFLLFIAMAEILKPGEDAVEPIALIIGPIMMNICYVVFGEKVAREG